MGTIERMLLATFSVLLGWAQPSAALEHAQDGVTILKPQSPAPSQPKYRSIAPAAENRSHFVAKTKHVLEFAARNPAPANARSAVLAGTEHYGVEAITPQVLTLLQAESAAFDSKLHTRLLQCGNPALKDLGEVTVVLVEAERGGMAMPVFMTPESDALRYFELSVDLPGDPVLMVITGYTGLAMRITASHRTRIAAVHLHTYYPSVVLGVDPSRVTRQYLGHRHGCDYGFGDGVKGPAVIERLGLKDAKILRFTTQSKAGHELAIGPPQATRRDPPRLGSFLDTEMPAPHSYGILALHYLGFIRPINNRPGTSAVGFAYEVLKPFRMPEGLAGGHSVRFVVSNDALAPSGDLAHSSIVQPLR